MKRLLLFVFCVASLGVRGASHYVSTNGNDSFDGSITTPWQTITHACANSNPGDTILVTNGQFFSEIVTTPGNRHGTLAKPITLISYGGGRTSISMNNSFGVQIGPTLTVGGAQVGGFYIKDSNYNVDGFEVTSNSPIVTQKFMLIAVAGNCTNVNFTSMWVHDTPGLGVGGAPGMGPGAFGIGATTAGIITTSPDVEWLQPQNCTVAYSVISNTCFTYVNNFQGHGNTMYSNLIAMSNTGDVFRDHGGFNRFAWNILYNCGAGGPRDNGVKEHPDMIQEFIAPGNTTMSQYHHDWIFDHNQVWDSHISIGQISEDRPWGDEDGIYYCNLLVGFDSGCSCGTVGIKWYYNDFIWYGAHSQDINPNTGLPYVKQINNSVTSANAAFHTVGDPDPNPSNWPWDDGRSVGRADAAQNIGNIYFECSNDPSLNQQGFYVTEFSQASITNMFGRLNRYNFVCGSSGIAKTDFRESDLHYTAGTNGWQNGGTPNFVGTNSGDFRLKAISKLVGAGPPISVPWSSLPDWNLDIYGNPRPETGWDIGCFQQPGSSIPVGIAPIITFQPQPQTNIYTTTCEMSCNAYGSVPMTFYWYRNGVFLPTYYNGNAGNIPATNAFYYIYPVDYTNTGNYQCIVSNAFGMATSSLAYLDGQNQGPPVIIQQPASKTLTAGSSYSPIVKIGFTPTFLVSNIPAYWYRQVAGNWVYLTNCGGGSGGLAPSITISNIQAGVNDGNYQVIVSNILGVVVSSLFTISLSGSATSPNITTDLPTDVWVKLGDSANFNLIANGTAPLRYNWYLNGNYSASQTTHTYTTGTTVAGDDGDTFQCVVTNTAGTATSILATMHVGAPIVITTQPQNLITTVGGNATFSVSTTGDNPINYQWYFNNSQIIGANIATYPITSATLGNAGNYKVVINNPWSLVTSSVASLTVNPAQATNIKFIYGGKFNAPGKQVLR